MTILFSEEEKALQSKVRKRGKEKIPAQTVDFSRTIGVFPYDAVDRESEMAGPTEKSVALVHGLDDPGKVWQNLAPALDYEGYAAG